MRIISCKPFLEKEIPWLEVNLNDRRVVIDGQNFFYDKYDQSGLEDRFGCECDKYAEFLRAQLQPLHRTCVFVFKGGHDAEHWPPRGKHERWSVTEPLLSREVYKQVLDEMGFEYAVSEFSVNDDCVALARTLRCPILANNVHYFFSNVQYIPFTTLDRSNMSARQYQLQSLLNKYNIGNRQVATFLTLFDTDYFSSEDLEDLLKKLRLTTTYSLRMNSFLSWMGRNGERAAALISRNLAADERPKLQLEIQRRLENVIVNRPAAGPAAQYLLDKHQVRICAADPDWFAKGVALKFIPIPYINVYHWRVFNMNDDDFVAAPIVRYAYDLLTDFSDQELVFKRERIGLQSSDGESDAQASINVGQSVRRPNYGSGNVFKDGWDDIRSLKLFDHFLSETLHISEWERLESAPEHAKLLIVALVYAARRGRDGAAARDAGRAALLCHALLTAGRRAAAPRLPDADKHVDTNVFRAVRQLQHCLRHLNFLNTLCGAPLPPTDYTTSFNATFVYCAARQPARLKVTDCEMLNLMLDVYNHLVDVQ